MTTADLTSFTSGRPDWDAPLDAGGVIDLHVCLTAETAGDLNAVTRLTAQLAHTLCAQLQQIAPGATVHTGLRNKMWDRATSQPSWGDRLFHAQVNRLFAEMATSEGSCTGLAGSPTQSAEPPPQELDTHLGVLQEPHRQPEPESARVRDWAGSAR